MRHDCNQAMNAEKPMIVDDLRRHAEWLKVAVHCPSASGGRVRCCAKMRLATGPLPQTQLETRGLVIRGHRVRFTGDPPARVMKMVDTGDLISAADSNACRFDSDLVHQGRQRAQLSTAG